MRVIPIRDRVPEFTGSFVKRVAQRGFGLRLPPYPSALGRHATL